MRPVGRLRSLGAGQQKRGWTRRSRGAGIHPPSPGMLATAARAGTQGAPSRVRCDAYCSTSDCPALLFGNRDTRSSEAIGAVPCDMQAHKGRRAVRRCVATTWKARSPLNLLVEGEMSTERAHSRRHGRRASPVHAVRHRQDYLTFMVQIATAPQVRSGDANCAGISEMPRKISTALIDRRSMRPSPSVNGSLWPGMSVR